MLPCVYRSNPGELVLLFDSSLGLILLMQSGGDATTVELDSDEEVDDVKGVRRLSTTP